MSLLINPNITADRKRSLLVTWKMNSGFEWFSYYINFISTTHSITCFLEKPMNEFNTTKLLQFEAGYTQCNLQPSTSYYTTVRAESSYPYYLPILGDSSLQSNYLSTGKILLALKKNLINK